MQMTLFLQKNDMAEVTRLKKHLCFDFEIEDLHELSCFLGIEVARSKKEIVIWLQEYTLHELRLVPIYTLYNGRYRFLSSGVSAKSVISIKPYQRVVVQLLCLTRTRPNISYAFNVVSQFSTL